MSKAAAIIRPPHGAEAEPIATLMSAGMSTNVRRITILGSAGLHRWVAAQIDDTGGDDLLVATIEERIVGMVSSRRVGSTRVLNHLYTHADFRQRGIARALLASALDPEAERVAVDVFSESRIARAWYAALGFVVEIRRLWVETALPFSPPSSPRVWTTTGLAEADAAQASQGFSHFTLTTDSGTYAIARLGEAVFRYAGFGLLGDAAALTGLASLDARRALLCSGASEDAPRAGRVVEESERLSTPRATLAAALDHRVAEQQ